MYISIFDLFKIGLGPSSSHTVGPMVAASMFVNSYKTTLKKSKKIKINLYGSLAYTCKGHGTDKAIILGLLGEKPESININEKDKIVNDVISNKNLNFKEHNLNIPFNLDNDLILVKGKNDYKYSNTLIFSLIDENDNLLCENIYYSIGGGFIIDESDKNQFINNTNKMPFPFKSGKELLDLCNKNNLAIYELIMSNEEVYTNRELVKSKILNIWKVMNKSIYNGMKSSGTLDGGLNIKRRANGLYKTLIKKTEGYDPLYVMDWVNIFAIAVSEENASFGRIVTAPTNGAAGIIPAVIKYYSEFCEDSDNKGIIRFFLTATAIGSLFKLNASISGAEAGCQGEVGVACSMAAGGLVAALKGTNQQIENAAEIAMEHNLGLTCDPINGLVQIPCIERNAMGAMKAINAARLSINGSGQHKVSLDEVISTMWETGKNMNSIYKETSKGGLAVNVIEC